MGGAHRGEDPWAAWPHVPAVLRVMAGWFLVGIGALNLAVTVDGGLTGPFLIFHVALLAGGVLLLTRHRIRPSRAGYLVSGLLALAGMAIATVPANAHCCLADHPQRRGYPFPFLGTGDGVHVDPEYLVADLVFGGCAGLLVLTVLTVIEQRLPERRTPVDLGAYTGRHAEPRAMAATGDRSGENVGGLP
ncbi:hypothetical protein AB0F72_27395 [Actinoplanes sp. NPDC023936]|uniref:hypothetical protein n=1 Tax=Actinoplanes sp. NPDC023936 TaxID=3154910 RepID=UPI0033C2E766